MADLRATQSLISELIRATDGVERTLARAEEQRSGALHAAELRSALEASVRSDSRLAAAKRLEVYANAYFYRILDCLKEDFPVLLESIGDERFHDLITAYLLAHPSDHFSMRQVGRHLPRFLARADATAGLRASRPWAPDLARLEWALLDAFDAPDAAAATRADLASVPPEEFGDLQFFLHPSLQRLELDARAVRLHDAPRGTGAEPGPAEDSSAHVLVWRRDEAVRTRRLEPDEAQALECLARGATFGQVCVEIAKRVGEEQAAPQVARWLAAWIDLGCLAQDPA